MKIGSLVKVHGKNYATVTGIHGNGKRLAVTYTDGKTTFVNASAVTDTGAWRETVTRTKP